VTGISVGAESIAAVLARLIMASTGSAAEPPYLFASYMATLDQIRAELVDRCLPIMSRSGSGRRRLAAGI